MDSTIAGGASMARKKVKNSMPMRLSEEAIRLARIASGYTGESMAEYISRITCERSREDIEKLHQELKDEKPSAEETEVPPAEATKPKAKRAKPGDGDQAGNS